MTATFPYLAVVLLGVSAFCMSVLIKRSMRLYESLLKDFAAEPDRWFNFDVLACRHDVSQELLSRVLYQLYTDNRIMFKFGDQHTLINIVASVKHIDSILKEDELCEMVCSTWCDSYHYNGYQANIARVMSFKLLHLRGAKCRPLPESNNNVKVN
jgi:hypothetical protein